MIIPVTLFLIQEGGRSVPWSTVFYSGMMFFLLGRNSCDLGVIVFRLYLMSSWGPVGCICAEERNIVNQREGF